MPSSCKDIRAALASCLQSSPCVLQQRHTASECLRPPLVDTLPTQCQQLKHAFGDCRRGMVDMRKRFRGNGTMGIGGGAGGVESGGGKGGMLYAGRSVYGNGEGEGGVKEEGAEEGGEGK